MDEGAYRRAERALWARYGVDPAERWVTLPGSGQQVRVQEAGEGAPAVLLHGGTNAGVTFAPLVAALDDVACIVVDRPGCGLSPPLRRPLDDLAALERLADGFVPDLLDGLGLERADVVATSMGGLFALRGAAAAPARVDHLVGIAWMMGAPITDVPLSMRLGSVPGMSRLMSSVRPSRRMIHGMLGSVLGPVLDRLPDEFLDWFASLLRDSDTMRNEMAYGSFLIRPIKGFDERTALSDDLLGRIEAQVGFVWGEDDYFGGADAARTFAGRVPGAELVLVPGAGHAPWLDDTDLVAREVRRLLAR